MTVTVRELGESGVLARILRHFAPARRAILGPGDDCAVLSVSGALAVTSDTMIEGTDFRTDWHTGEELGWKLAATNFSDVAAMGATPIGLTVSLACPPTTPVGLLEDIARGLQRACDELAPGCSVVGGDLAEARQIVGAVTAMGDLDGVEPVTRAGANPGDTVAYAGELGLAGLGLRALLEHGGPEARRRAPEPVRAHLSPSVPVGLGPLAASGRATAMMDVSDGLSLDASRMGEASGVTLHLSSERLTRAFGNQRGVRVRVQDMLTGGEDHGLLATFPADATLPEGFQPIGTVIDRGARLLLDGEAVEPQGWDALRH